MLFSSYSRFRRGQQECIKAATIAMYSVVGKCRTFALPVDLQMELVKITVVPVILYGRQMRRNILIRKVDILHEIFKTYVVCGKKYMY